VKVSIRSCWIYMLALLGQIEGAVNPVRELADFHELFFPRTPHRDVEWAKLFDENFLPRKYDFSVMDGDFGRAQAYLDARFGLTKDIRYKKFMADWSVLDSRVPNWVLEDFEFFPNTDPLSAKAVTVWETYSPQSKAEHLLSARDLWQVLAYLKSGRRSWVREDKYRKQHDGMTRWYDALAVRYNRFVSEKGSLKWIQGRPGLNDVIEAISDESSANFIREVSKRKGFQEAPFNPNWAHPHTFAGASQIRIWRWTSEETPPKRFAMLVRFPSIPLQAESEVLQPVRMIEEVFLAGVGEQPDFAEPSGNFPWRSQLRLDRNRWLERGDTEAAQSKPYLKLEDPNTIALMGFSMDAPTELRPGYGVAPLKFSCIECHGSPDTENKLVFWSERKDWPKRNNVLTFDEASETYRIQFLPYDFSGATQ
jgi:hypothetical protein